ncbi:outer membrane beta-barrel protein, partial [Parabacteroides merdae]
MKIFPAYIRSDYLTQSGNVGIRYQSDRWNAMLRLETQWANLKGDLTYPQSEHHSRSYFSVLPSLMFHYVLDQTNSLQFRYRSITSSPSITDLQSVVNNSNPLFLFAGNPYLDQELSHIANLRYIHTTKSGHTFIAM